jgi:hypothetical protein
MERCPMILSVPKTLQSRSSDGSVLVDAAAYL